MTDTTTTDFDTRLGATGFPDLPIVKVELFTDPYDIWRISEVLLTAGISVRSRRLSRNDLPEAAATLRGHVAGHASDRYSWGADVRFVEHDKTGNFGNYTGHPNIIAVFAPATSWASGKGYHMTGGLVVATLGCDHQWTTTNLGRCYNRYRCTACGYHYSVDSGD